MSKTYRVHIGDLVDEAEEVVAAADAVEMPAGRLVCKERLNVL